MEKLKAGFIGFMPFGASMDETFKVLEKYAAIGYKGVEMGDMFLRNGDPAENLARLKDLGMEPLCTSLPMGKPDLSAVPEIVERAHKLGVHRAACMGSTMRIHEIGMRVLEHFPTYDESMEELEGLENMAKALKKEGIDVTFHNHETEFLTFYNGEAWFDLMVRNSEDLKFELDTGWAMYGHRDPVKVMDLLGDRLAALHLKDYMEGNVPRKSRALPGMDGTKLYQFNTPHNFPNLCAPGAGKLPVYDILEKAQQMGIDYAIIEQDFQKILSQEEAVLLAYLVMKETGFVE